MFSTLNYCASYIFLVNCYILRDIYYFIGGTKGFYKKMLIDPEAILTMESQLYLLAHNKLTDLSCKKIPTVLIVVVTLESRYF